MPIFGRLIFENMWLIVALILVGTLLLVAELVLLPGFTVAGICAFAADAAAVWLGFARYGTSVGLIVLGVVIAISAVATYMSLRARTWQRFSLKDSIDGVSQQLPADDGVKPGDRGTATTRLAPMGKVLIDGKIYEAKSIDAFVDQNTPVEVCEFDNFSIVVKKVIS